MRVAMIVQTFACAIAVAHAVPLVAQQTAPIEDPASTLITSAASAVLQGIAACWVVDPDSAGATVAVTVAFSLDRSGRVDGEIDLVAHSSASVLDRDMAFAAARRAILRCQGDGFALIAQEYDTWKRVNMTFDPAELTIR